MSSDEQAVRDLVGSSVAAHSDKSTIAAAIIFARKLGGFAGLRGLHDFQSKAAGAQAFERRTNQLAAASAARSRIHHRHEGVVHSFTAAARSMVLPISSARTVRLIFNDAVRGKSRSQIR